MSDSNGPKVDIPDDLVAELDESESSAADASAGTGEDGVETEEGAESEEVAHLKDRYLRLAAEFENFKRRTLKERQDLLHYGNENLIKELLGTVDNLERALVHAREQEEGLDKENLLEGVELIHRSLMQALEKAGVEVVEAEGQPFDPKHHEALRQVPAGGRDPGIVVEVYQKGYLLRQRLLRPALVAVTGPAEESEDEVQGHG